LRRLLLCLWFLFVVRPIVRIVMGVTVFGRDHLRFDSPVIIIANHNSHLDAAVLMDLLPLRRLHTLRPVAAADYFEKQPIRRIVFRHCMNVLPIRRDKVTREFYYNDAGAQIDNLTRSPGIAARASRR
jgi:1-acyl-sn-glycerol-3-phosphate acyltransferase